MLLFLMIPLMLLGVAIAVVPLLWTIAGDYKPRATGTGSPASAPFAVAGEASPSHVPALDRRSAA